MGPVSHKTREGISDSLCVEAACARGEIGSRSVNCLGLYSVCEKLHKLSLLVVVVELDILELDWQVIKVGRKRGYDEKLCN